MPFESKGNMKPDLLIDDLPDDLAALAAQLADDAERLAAQYPCAYGEGTAAVARDRGRDGQRFSARRYLSWTRVAAVLAVATGTTLGALWQLRDRDAQNAAIGQPVPPAGTSGLATLAEDIARVAPSSGSAVVPTFVSADAAEGLSGEEIEVLADAFAGQVAEI